MNTMQPASRAPGRFLLLLKLLALCLTPVVLGYQLSVAVLMPGGWSVLMLLLGLLELVLAIIFAYTLHADLGSLHADYPISPGQALALVLIPGYNLWGIWSSWQVASGYLPRVTLGRLPLPSVAALISARYIMGGCYFLFRWVHPHTITALLITNAALAFVSEATSILLVLSATRGMDSATGHDQFLSTQWR